MKVCVVGSGAIGGFYGAKLARAGHDVTFIARGAHLQAIRAQGLFIKSPLGDFNVKAAADDRPETIGPVDFVIYAVKTYSNPGALPLLKVVAGDHAVVLTLQNGVDSVAQIEAVIGKGRVLGGATYVAAALTGPGVIEQTGTHRRVVFGETAGDVSRVSDRVQLIDTLFTEADILSEPVANAWLPLWEKFIYLAPFAGFTGASRLPIGPIWSDGLSRDLLVSAFKEVEALARAERVRLPAGTVKRIIAYVDSLQPTVRSSLLIDLQQGKPTEVEGLLGAVVRRGKRRRLRTPIMSVLYALLKGHSEGARTEKS
jgi:2-dehydropantoate 2-reductase